MKGYWLCSGVHSALHRGANTRSTGECAEGGRMPSDGVGRTRTAAPTTRHSPLMGVTGGDIRLASIAHEEARRVHHETERRNSRCDSR